MRHVAPITVGIATRDRPGDLARCLDAVLGGTVLPAEVLVIDQSRDEETATVVSQRAATSPVVVRCVRQLADGLSRSRNGVVAHATSDVVAVTDDDCVPDAHWVEVVATELTADSRLDAIAGRVLPLGPERDGLVAVSSRTSTRRHDYVGKAPPWLVGTGANFAARTARLRALGAYDVRLGVGSDGKAGEDMDMIHRLLRDGARIRYEPDAIVYHERQPVTQRAKSRRTYGHGIGACCGLWAREGDTYAALVLVRWVAMRLSRLGRALRHGNREHAREEIDVLRGTASGLVYGLRAAARDSGAAEETPISVPHGKHGAIP